MFLFNASTFKNNLLVHEKSMIVFFNAKVYQSDFRQW